VTNRLAPANFLRVTKLDYRNCDESPETSVPGVMAGTRFVVFQTGEWSSYTRIGQMREWQLSGLARRATRED